VNSIDLLLALVIALGVASGVRRGALHAAAALAALASSLVFAFAAYPYGLALAERAGLEWGVWTAPAAFLIAYAIARILLGVLLGRAVARVPARIHANAVNRALGAIPGAANGTIDATILALLLIALPLSDAVTGAARDSAIVSRLTPAAEWLEARLRPIFNPALERTLSKLVIEPHSGESVKLPFTVQDPRPRPDLEVRMLDLVNEERRTRGLRPLRADPEAAAVARAHSIDMFRRGYFSHVTPEGANPFERMRRAGLRYFAAGENLALARSLGMAHQGLMHSPGHRANILRPAFGRVGIGIVDGGRYGLMVTQTFRN
jgi:uncharacterized protein YkwD